MATKTISNATSYAGGYTLDGAYQTISITTSGYVGGTGITGGTLSAYTILNDGSIAGTVNYGIYLNDGGYVANAASASITGSYDGILIESAAGTVVNSGSITGTSDSGSGIDLGRGGSVTNAASASITGGSVGVVIFDAAGTVVNYGTIDGGTDSVRFTTTGGVLEVDSGSKLIGEASGDGSMLEFGAGGGAGTLSGLSSGTLGGSAGSLILSGFTTYEIASGATWTLTQGNTITRGDTLINAGSIRGTVYLSGGYLLNQTGATITAYYDAVYSVVGSADNTVVNAGTIEGGDRTEYLGVGEFGVVLRDGGSVINTVSASITGYGGVYIGGAAGTVVNSGTIAGTTGAGIDLQDGGSITNAVSAYIGGYVYSTGGVVNDGSIHGSVGGGRAGGAVTNAVSASITGSIRTAGTVINYGNIIYNSGSIFHGEGVFLYGDGAVTNAVSASITGSEDGIYGASFNGVLFAGTVVNYGLIDGGTNYSVLFSHYGNSGVLEVEAGSTLIGKASGDKSTLEFGAGGGAGTVSGLGGGALSGSAGNFAIGGFTAYEIAVDAAWTLTNANTIASGNTLSVYGTLIDAGTIVADGKLSDSGKIEVKGGTLDFALSVSGVNLDFTGAGLIDLAQLGVYTGINVDNFGAGDKIALTDIAHQSGDTVTYHSGHLYLYSSGDALLADLTLTKGTDVTGFTVINDGGGTEIETITCFMPGTRILTPKGEKPVEKLKCGSKVTTVDGRAVPVRWLGRQTVSTRFGDPLRVLPIRIKAGAIDENVPTRDLLCSPDHAFLIDEVLIQAHALVNGVTIVRERNVPEIFTFYHIECDRHELILAEGFAAETFVDNADRRGFDNWDEHLALYPEGKPIVEMPWPRAKAHRQVPLAVRESLARRAETAAFATSGMVPAALTEYSTVP